MTTEVATIQIEIPEGYYFKEYDYPKENDYYLIHGQVSRCGANNGYGKQVIVGRKSDVPKGYEFVRYDCPKENETFLNVEDYVIKASMNWFSEKRVIVKKIYQYVWPEFIKSGTWLYMDNNNNWYLSTSKPVKRNGYWGCDAPTKCLFVDASFFNFTPPECSDWTKSLIQKP